LGSQLTTEYTPVLVAKNGALQVLDSTTVAIDVELKVAVHVVGTEKYVHGKLGQSSPAKSTVSTSTAEFASW
jgi:hypothetical protein